MQLVLCRIGSANIACVFWCDESYRDRALIVYVQHIHTTAAHACLQLSGREHASPQATVLAAGWTHSCEGMYQMCLTTPLYLPQVEGVRDAALAAGRCFVEAYARSCLPLLLPAVEAGLDGDNWRIRQSSLELCGELLFKVRLGQGCQAVLHSAGQPRVVAAALC
jgi:hypothetical protein